MDNAKDAYIDCDVLMLNRRKACCPSIRTWATTRTVRSPAEPSSLRTVHLAGQESGEYELDVLVQDIINEECSELDIRGISCAASLPASATSRLL
ncbi:MAG: hypothetical protein ACLVJ6_13985 [Merdibacter sp.]